MIEIHNLHKAFASQKVLNGIDLRIEEGSRLCIVGSSGSGKSVFIKLLLGLLEPDSGTIRIDGQDTHRFQEQDWQRLLSDFGVVFQQSALFDSLSVQENIGIKLFEEKQFSEETINSKIVAALERVGLSANLLHRYPAELSGGMQKRVAIARAILHEPRYLVYDEPSSGLDPVNADIVDELVLSLAEEHQRTTIVVTHDMDSVRRIANQVVLLHGQQIAFAGSMHAFFASEQVEIQHFLRRIRSR